MRIVAPSWNIEHAPEPAWLMEHLERCARTCYRSEGKIDSGIDPCPNCNGRRVVRGDSEWGGDGAIRCDRCDGTGVIRARTPSSDKLIRHVLERGHESVIEHAFITVRFVVDRGVSHELVRHRLASFSQESTRYVRYDGEDETREVAFIRPCFWADPELPRTGKRGMVAEWSLWVEAMERAEESYRALLQVGAKPEEARSVLPNSLRTEIVVTANIREWRHILRLRTSPKAHPQMREVMVPLAAELARRYPVLFGEFR